MVLNEEVRTTEKYVRLVQDIYDDSETVVSV